MTTPQNMAFHGPRLLRMFNCLGSIMREHHSLFASQAAEFGDDLCADHPWSTSCFLGTTASSMIAMAALHTGVQVLEDEKTALVLGGNRVAVTKREPRPDENGGSVLPFPSMPVPRGPARWCIEFTIRWPDRDRMIVGTGSRTLRETGWCADERALPTPDIGLDEPLHLLDYFKKIVVIDAERPSVTLPVYCRHVATGRKRRMDTSYDAFGRIWSAGGDG